MGEPPEAGKKLGPGPGLRLLQLWHWGFSSPAEAALCSGRKGESEEEQTATSNADKSVPNIRPCHEGLVFHKTIPAINWVLMCDASLAVGARAAACGLAL